MVDVYADDADVDPMKVSYDRPTVLAMAGDVRGKRVLDAGCATGALSEAFLARGATVVGIDLNPHLLKRARARLGAGVDLHVADLSAPMPFLESSSFDLVAASLVLHYLADWTTPLSEFARVLRPGGALVLSTHHPAQDIAIADPPAPYFETVLLTDTWRKVGREFTVRFYHRPLSAIVDDSQMRAFSSSGCRSRSPTKMRSQTTPRSIGACARPRGTYSYAPSSPVRLPFAGGDDHLATRRLRS